MGFLDRFRKNKNKKDEKETSPIIEKFEKNIESFKEENTANRRNFKHLNDKIKSGSKHIVLDSDIIFDYDTDLEFKEGISIQNDNIVIDGNGFSIDAKGKSRIFQTSGNNIVLKNITLKNSIADYGSAILNTGSLTVEKSFFIDNQPIKGGTIINKGSSELKILHTKFSNNQSEGNGAAIHNSSKVEIVDSSFLNNSANNGGGIYNQHSGKIKIVNCEFSNNKSKSYGSAISNSGSIHVKDSSFDNHISSSSGGAITNGKICEVENCTFTNNKSKIRSGALYNFQDSYLTVRKSTFTNNSSKYGSGIFNEGDLKVCDCDFVDNLNTSSGTIYNKEIDSNTKVLRSSFLNNHSKEYGGAIFTEGDLKIKHGKFEGNIALDGGAIGCLKDSSLSFCDCEFSNNACDENGGAIFSNSKLELKNIDFKNNYAKDGAAIWCGQYSFGRIENAQFYDNKAEQSGTLLNWGEITGANISFKNNSSENESIITNHNILKLNEVRFEENISNSNSPIISNTGEMEIFKSNFIKQEKNTYIGNERFLRIVESTFEDNNLESVVKNDENGSLSLLSCNFINNSTEIATIHNLGEYCGIMGPVFKDNSSNKEYCQDIYNESVLSLQDPKFKNEKTVKSILNNGHMNIRKLKRSQSKEHIQDNGSIDFLTYDEEEIENPFNFTFLDNLVHGPEKIIDLNEDIKLDNYEIDFYEGGIELDVDDLVIMGNGVTIDANHKSRIFKVTGKNITIENITFKNGAFLNIFEKHTSGGGAIKIVHDGSITLKDCRFINNTSQDDGGAILNNGELISINSVFENNESELYGGAVYNNYECDLKEDEFNHNNSDIGGAIYNYGELTIDNLKLKGNISNIRQEIVNNKNYNIKNMSENISDLIYDMGNENQIEESESDSFEALNEVINDSEELKLLNDIIFDKTTDEQFKKGIIIANEDLIIDGDGFSIDAGEVSSIFMIKRVSTVIFKNITFKNGFSRDNPIISNEGHICFENCTFENNKTKDKALLIENENTVDLIDCVFSNNTSEEHVVMNKGELNITKSKFFNNNSKKGGIIFNNSESSTKITNSEYVSNSAGSYGILFNNSEMIVNESKFITNHAIIGGGIYNNSNLEVNNCEFTNNNVDLRGGGIYNRGKTNCKKSKFENNISKELGAIVNESGFVEIRNCEFMNNNAHNGGAITNFDKMDIYDSKFIKNESREGGAINNQPDTLMNIQGCEFIENKSEQGGAIINREKINMTQTLFKNNFSSLGGAINNSGECDLNISNCEFIENKSDTIGGCIFNFNKLTIEKSRFIGNTAFSEEYAHSGVIYNENGGSIYIKDSEFIKNKAKMAASVIFNNSELNVRNSKFIDNSTEMIGGAIYNYENSNFTHIKCEFNGNTPNDYN